MVLVRCTQSQERVIHTRSQDVLRRCQQVQVPRIQSLALVLQRVRASHFQSLELELHRRQQVQVPRIRTLNLDFHVSPQVPSDMCSITGETVVWATADAGATSSIAGAGKVTSSSGTTYSVTSEGVTYSITGAGVTGGTRTPAMVRWIGILSSSIFCVSTCGTSACTICSQFLSENQGTSTTSVGVSCISEVG